MPITGSYTTVTPTTNFTSKISPGDNAVVGVAAPVIVRFGSAPTDKALVEQHVTITTTPKVEGAWAWITHDGDTWPSLDWRPKEYWPAGTTVHVESDLYGVDLGGGTFGGDKVTSDFTIGRNQVVLADANSHSMVVQQNGVTVATYDASYGSGDIIGDPNRVTRSGIAHRDGQAGNHHDEQPRLRLHRRHRTLGGADQRQRRVHPPEPGHRRRPGRGQRQPRLHQPVRGRRRRPTSRPRSTATRSRSPAPASSCRPPTATSTTGPSRGREWTTLANN